MLSTIFTFYPTSEALTNYPLLNDGWFYIKNAYTGFYLDVKDGIAQGGTNVQQCQWNGSEAQRWYLSHRGNGVYMLYTEVGSTISNNVRYLNYALDVDNGIDANGVNLHIWNASQDGITQTFSFQKTDDSTYMIKTACSNYTKVASLADNICSNGINVHQWEYSNHSHDHWVLEPIDNIPDLGVEYALANCIEGSHKRLDLYPDVSNLTNFLGSGGGNCTNFVSQCLLAGGALHQNGNWYVYRKNTEYSDCRTTSQLNYSWDLADPSPWISTKNFAERFAYEIPMQWCSGQFILDNPGTIFALNIHEGDVIQIASPTNEGKPDAAFHSMYITGFTEGYIDGKLYPIYSLTYHSTDRNSVSLFEIANRYKDDIFLFYDFT